MIEHTVTFEHKHGTDSPEERELLEAARELATIPGVKDFRIRRQTSPKNRHSFGISMMFSSPEDYTAYQHHPVHDKFVRDRWMVEVVDFLEADFEEI